MAYAIGLDYGTNSVRCLIVDTADGNELATAVYEYETGEAGIVLDGADHNLARQNPADYVKGIEVTVTEALRQAKDAEGDRYGFGRLSAALSPGSSDAMSCQERIMTDVVRFVGFSLQADDLTLVCAGRGGES